MSLKKRNEDQKNRGDESSAVAEERQLRREQRAWKDRYYELSKQYDLLGLALDNAEEELDQAQAALEDAEADLDDALAELAKAKKGTVEDVIQNFNSVKPAMEALDAYLGHLPLEKRKEVLLPFSEACEKAREEGLSEKERAEVFAAIAAIYDLE